MLPSINFQIRMCHNFVTRFCENWVVLRRITLLGIPKSRCGQFPLSIVSSLLTTTSIPQQTVWQQFQQSMLKVGALLEALNLRSWWQVTQRIHPNLRVAKYSRPQMKLQLLKTTLKHKLCLIPHHLQAPLLSLSIRVARKNTMSCLKSKVPKGHGSHNGRTTTHPAVPVGENTSSTVVRHGTRR